MKYLFVVAHPDDETLGAGATIKKLTNSGNEVAVCVMANHAAARKNISATLKDDEKKAMDILGVKKVYEGDFPNIKMNTVSHLELVQFIEAAIEDFGAEVIITHHPSDTNNDHMHTSMACQAAVRLFQRKENVTPLKELWFMEVLSSTEWSTNTALNQFRPNTYVEAGKENIDVKLKALDAYVGVMRPFPHPRSEEAITGLAAYRGGQSGCNYAEAFECVLRRV